MISLGKRVLLVLAGFAAGVAFIVACGSSGGGLPHFGPGNAAAQAGCSQYEVQILDTSSVAEEIDTLPAGWVPFAVTSGPNVVAFRCAK